MVQKKSLISNSTATKKAVTASTTSKMIQASEATSLSKGGPHLSKGGPHLSKGGPHLSKGGPHLSKVIY